MPFCNECGMRIDAGRLCDVCIKDEQLPGHDWEDVAPDAGTGLTTRAILDAIDRYEQRVRNDHSPGAEHWKRHADQMRLALVERGREVRGEVKPKA